MTKIAGSGSESGSISQRHGSADPHQNVMDPEHCLIHKVSSEKKLNKGNNNANYERDLRFKL